MPCLRTWLSYDGACLGETILDRIVGLECEAECSRRMVPIQYDDYMIEVSRKKCLACQRGGTT